MIIIIQFNISYLIRFEFIEAVSEEMCEKINDRGRQVQDTRV